MMLFSPKFNTTSRLKFPANFSLKDAIDPVLWVWFYDSGGNQGLQDSEEHIKESVSLQMVLVAAIDLAPIDPKSPYWSSFHIHR